MMTVAAQASGQAINITAVIVALIGTAGAVLSYIQASQVRREQRRASSREVEAEAYQRARQFDMETVESIRKETERLRELLRSEQQSNDELRKQAASLGDIEARLVDVRNALENEKQISQSLRNQIVRMEARIRSMRESLIEYLDGRMSKEALQLLIDESDELLADGPNGNQSPGPYEVDPGPYEVDNEDEDDGPG